MGEQRAVRIQTIIIRGFQPTDVIINRSPADTSTGPVDDIPRATGRVAFDAAQVLINLGPTVTTVKPYAVDAEPMRTNTNVIHGERCGDAVVFVVAVIGDSRAPDQRRRGGQEVERNQAQKEDDEK